jgi:hypothetical protein
MKEARSVGGREDLHVSGKYVPFRTDLPVEARLYALAESQHWVLSHTQLQFAGLSASAIRKRAAKGRLHRIHRGVYAVGRPQLNARGRWMAAVLAYGRSAVLSHASAAELWGIHRSARPQIHITLPSRDARSRPRIEVHRSATLAEADVAHVDRIPCTSVARTLVDLGDHAKRRDVEELSTSRSCFVSSISAPCRMPSAGRAAAAVRACCVRCSPTTPGRR